MAVQEIVLWVMIALAAALNIYIVASRWEQTKDGLRRHPRGVPYERK